MSCRALGREMELPMLHPWEARDNFPNNSGKGSNRDAFRPKKGVAFRLKVNGLLRSERNSH